VESEIKKAGGAALFVKADVVQSVAKSIHQCYCQSLRGRIDIAFNNAGYEGQVVPFTEQTLVTGGHRNEHPTRGVFRPCFTKYRRCLNKAEVV